MLGFTRLANLPVRPEDPLLPDSLVGSREGHDDQANEAVGNRQRGDEVVRGCVKGTFSEHSADHLKIMSEKMNWKLYAFCGGKKCCKLDSKFKQDEWTESRSWCQKQFLE